MLIVGIFFGGALTVALLVFGLLLGRSGAEPAKRSESFVDSMCVGVHWDYNDTVYGQHYDKVRDKLAELGFRHVRSGGSSTDVIDKMKELAALGIKSTFVLDPSLGTKPDSTYWGNPPNYPIKDFVKDINDPSENGVGTDVIDAVEMHNEIDITYGDKRWYPDDSTPLSNDPDSSRYWVKYIRVATRDTHAALESDPVTAGIPLYGPSLTSEQAYTIVGDLSASIDYSNVHWYLAGRHPETSGWGDNGYGSHPYHVYHLARRQSPSDPVVATEGGYSNAVNQNFTNTSEEVTARYLPRLFLHSFNGGFERFCAYELVDEWPNPEKDDNEKNFGLLRNDLSEKPAYVALKNLTDLLKDPGSSFTTGSLDYSLSGETTDVHRTLLHKRDGRFYVVLWVGKPSYDPTNGEPIEVPSQRVTLTLNQPIEKASTYLPNESASPTAHYDAPAHLTLDVPDHPLVVELSPSSLPAQFLYELAEALDRLPWP